jgi:NifU-like protein involved in Fe-S cluster formation
MLSADDFRELFESDVHIGTLAANEGPVLSATVGSAELGLVVQLSLQVEQGLIQQAKFKVYGDQYALVAGQLFVRAILGKKLAEIGSLADNLFAELATPNKQVIIATFRRGYQQLIDQYQSMEN